MIVKVDEPKFGKRKCNKGHAVEGQWIVGGVERGSDELFLVEVHNRMLAQQLMRAIAYCAHPSIRDYLALRYTSRCLDHVVSLKRDPQCLSPQESLVLIYRSTAVGMKG
ncbi:hypothetical protein TNCV_501231 [Trichonephila clavipes]|nr:hypothetical protein TNCV_501231 [Trichonephila clavipes]